MGFSFDSLGKLLGKEHAKLVEATKDAIEERADFHRQAQKFLDGGDLPRKTAADIDKLLTDTEALILAAAKKTSDKDKTATLTEAARAMQANKIDHRELVGTLLSSFQGLDNERAKVIAGAAKKVIALNDTLRKAIHADILRLIQTTSKSHAEANAQILLHGGAANESPKIAADTAKLLGRPVKTAVDLDEFKSAQKAGNELESMLEDLKKVEKLIKG